MTPGTVRRRGHRPAPLVAISVLTIVIAVAVALTRGGPADAADEPVPTPSESVTTTAEPTATPTPSDTLTNPATTPGPTHPGTPGPSTVSTPSPGTGPTPDGTGRSTRSSGSRTSQPASATPGADPFLIDVAHESLRSATTKARAAQNAAERAQAVARQARHESDLAAAAMTEAEAAAVSAREVVGEIARAMYAYNLNSETAVHPESVMLLAPLQASSPSEYIDQSNQLSKLAQSVSDQYLEAQQVVDLAQSRESAAALAEATATAEARRAAAAEATALGAQKAARQVFRRLTGDTHAGTEAWWADAASGSDLGEALSRMRRGPEVTLEFQRPGSGAVTSDYGMRMHPILHVYKLHTGIDYAVGDGKIRAAKSGSVVRSGFDVAYGNYIVILHGQVNGRSVATLYAHAAALYVRRGDRVQTGDVIGLVGSTGYATGPHLHFEVRLAGRPVDPAPLLP